LADTIIENNPSSIPVDCSLAFVVKLPAVSSVNEIDSVNTGDRSDERGEYNG
jgi:hypothetical protein